MTRAEHEQGRGLPAIAPGSGNVIARSGRCAPLHCAAVSARARIAMLARAARNGAWPLVALALAALAYAPLLRASVFVPSRYGFELALFRPAPMPPLLVIAVAGWIAWRRRLRLRALPVRRGPILAGALFALAAAATAWAALAQAALLLFASAAAMLLAFAAAARGRAGCRALLLPSLVLGLGLAFRRRSSTSWSGSSSAGRPRAARGSCARSDARSKSAARSCGSAIRRSR